jgi:oxygen-dependent protoporphyrinogen oxidase
MGIINYNTIFKTSDSENYQYNLFVRLAQNDNEDHLAKQAQSELESIYNISGSPIHSNHKVYKHAIPQFNVGYAEIINHVVEYEKRNPSIEFIGNWKTGVSIGDCIHL